jgi:hypothetical protein
MVTDDLTNVLVGIVSAIVAIVVLQTWPPRYKWSKDVSLTTGMPSRRPVYQVKLLRRRRRIFKNRRNPMDLMFRARVATWGIGNRPNNEKIVPIPTTRPWRPSVGRTVLLPLAPHLCEEEDLRYFPTEIRKKCRAGTLTLDDLLTAGERSELRVYVFAYRPYIGTRWMLRGRYTHDDIKPGRFQAGGGVVIVPPDRRPPEVEDLGIEHDHTTSNDFDNEKSELRSVAPNAATFVTRLGKYSITVTRDRD